VLDASLVFATVDHRDQLLEVVGFDALTGESPGDGQLPSSDVGYTRVDGARTEPTGEDLDTQVWYLETLICSSEYFFVSGVRSWPRNGQ